MASASFSESFLLAQLGLVRDGEQRKKLLRVLNLDAQAVALVRPLELSEAALRALGTLDASDQRELATAVVADTTLAIKIRRIARRVKQKGYSIAKALAEACGQVYTGKAAEVGSASAAARMAHALDAASEADVHREDHDAASETMYTEGAPQLSPSLHTPLLDVGPDAADAVLRLLKFGQAGRTHHHHSARHDERHANHEPAAAVGRHRSRSTGDAAFDSTRRRALAKGRCYVV